MLYGMSLGLKWSPELVTAVFKTRRRPQINTQPVSSRLTDTDQVLADTGMNVRSKIQTAKKHKQTTITGKKTSMQC